MATKTNVVVKTEFDGMHCWRDCPIEDVIFLKHPHRHKFFVTVKMNVSHDDRDIEFFMLKADIDRILNDVFIPYKLSPTIKDMGSYSCEMLANDLIVSMTDMYPKVTEIFCSVFEDNENGSEVIWRRDGTVS